MQQVTSTTARPAISPGAARLTLGTAAAALLLLVVLHILRPDLDPSSHMVSEYAIGKFGWVQTLVFLLVAASSASLFVAIHSEVRTLWGKIGLVFLVLAAAGFFLGAVFNAEHPLHSIVFLIGAPSMSLAAVLISVSVARNPAWASARRLVTWVGQLPWISFVLNMGMFFVAISPSGEFDPGVPVGWANRLFWLGSGCWLIVMGWQAIKVSGQESS